MEARTINVPVNVPKSYRLDILQHRLTAYAQQLIDQETKKNKKQYRHRVLCGIFNSDATQEELVEDYLKKKYDL